LGVDTSGKHAAALCWFVLLPIVISWPLVLNLGTHIPGDGPGDNVAFLWNFWWCRQALPESGLDLFQTRYLFAPAGTPLVLHTHTALPAFIGATLFGSLPVVVAHNVVLLAGLAANGIATYVLAWRHVHRTMPALLAGTVFSGSAYVWIHMLGHFNLVHAWVLPLAAWAWIRLLDTPAASRGVIAGIAFAAAAYTDYYYLVFAAIVAAAWTVLFIWPIDVRWTSARWPRVERVLATVMVLSALLIAAVLMTGGFALELGTLRVSASRVRNPVALLWLIAIAWVLLRCRVVATRVEARPWREYAAALAAAFAVGFILTLPLTIAAIRLLASGEYVAPPHTWRSGPRGIDLLTIVLGHPLHGQRDVYARFGIDVMEQSAWPGLVALVLVAAILMRSVRLEHDERRWAWVAGLFLVWSCGAYLNIAGTDTGLPMPQALARLVPVLSNARMPGRAFVVVQLALAVILARVVTRAGWRPAILAGLTAVSVLDGAVTIPLYHLPESGLLEERVRTAGRQAVLELPLGIRDGFGETGRFDHRALVFQMTHRQPIAGGFVARLSPQTRLMYESSPALRSLMEFSSADRADIQPETAADLLALGITQIVVNTDAMPPSTRATLEAAGFRLVMVEGTRELYLVGGAP
jgi:hypothetical protein